MGDKLISAYRHTLNDVCCCILVAEDCVLPPMHEAKVPVSMSSDGTLYPPSNWAIKPQISWQHG